MRILITGAAGMVGSTLARSLSSDPPAGLAGLALVDVVPPRLPQGAAVPVAAERLDLTDAAAVAARVATRPDVIFHLAAVVSGEAEADFEKGYAVNLDGTRYLFEAIRAQRDYRPRVMFASSIAVYGAPFPEKIRRRVPSRAADELRHAEGDGRAAAQRLFAAGLFRRHRHPPADDLHPPGHAEQGGVGLLLQHPARTAGGQEAVLPVDDDVRHWHAQPARGGRVPAATR